MQLYFQSRDKARTFKANSKNPDNKQVKDHGKEAVKRWSVQLTLKTK